MNYLETQKCYEFTCSGRRWQEWRGKLKDGAFESGIAINPPGELTGAEALELISFLMSTMHARVPLGEVKEPSRLVAPITLVRPNGMVS